MTRAQRIRTLIILGLVFVLGVASAILGPKFGADPVVLVPMLVLAAFILVGWVYLILPRRHVGPESPDGGQG